MGATRTDLFHVEPVAAHHPGHEPGAWAQRRGQRAGAAFHVEHGSFREDARSCSSSPPSPRGTCRRSGSEPWSPGRVTPRAGVPRPRPEGGSIAPGIRSTWNMAPGGRAHPSAPRAARVPRGTRIRGSAPPIRQGRMGSPVRSPQHRPTFHVEHGPVRPNVLLGFVSRGTCRRSASRVWERRATVRRRGNRADRRSTWNTTPAAQASVPIAPLVPPGYAFAGNGLRPVSTAPVSTAPPVPRGTRRRSASPFWGSEPRSGGRAYRGPAFHVEHAPATGVLPPRCPCSTWNTLSGALPLINPGQAGQTPCSTWNTPLRDTDSCPSQPSPLFPG